MPRPYNAWEKFAVYLTRIAGIETELIELKDSFSLMYLTRVAGIETWYLSYIYYCMP